MVGYVAQCAVRGITLESLAIETGGEIDLRGFLGIDPAVKRGYESLPYMVRVKGNSTKQQFAEIHKAVMATSPNFYNLSRPVALKPTLVVEYHQLHVRGGRRTSGCLAHASTMSLMGQGRLSGPWTPRAGLPLSAEEASLRRSRGDCQQETFAEPIGLPSLLARWAELPGTSRGWTGVENCINKLIEV